jgi:hypothetical protein
MTCFKLGTDAHYSIMRIRVLLDTCAVRGVIHRDSAAKSLEQLEDGIDGFSIALADNAVVELALALYEGRLSWQHWIGRAPVIDNLLDKRSPIFPGDDEMQILSFGSTKPSSSLPRCEHRRAIWQLLKSAKGFSDLDAGLTFVGSDGNEYSITSSKKLATQLARAHRNKWDQLIASIRSNITASVHPTQEHIAELIFAKLCSGHLDDAMLRIRYDGYVKAVSRHESLALEKDQAYNPRSNKRKGDSFDIALLQALALPALICTLDNRLRNHVIESGSIQTTQLVTPIELSEGIKVGKLVERFPAALRPLLPH